MPAWLEITIGIGAGAGIIVGAVYLAFRPYLAVKLPKAWMPRQGVGTKPMPLSGADWYEPDGTC